MDDSRSARPVTMKDLALRLGLSQGSVSKALRDFSSIPLATRQRVQAVAREMGYRPNPMGTGLAQFKRTFKSTPIQAALGWINAWPDPKQLRAFRDFDLYWEGATRAAQKFGYRLEEFRIDGSISPHRLQKILLARNIRGILIPPHGRDRDTGVSFFDHSAFDWDEFSVVRFGHSIDLRVHSVASDQTANGMMAFNKILERGYERIAYVGPAHQGRFFGAGFLWAQGRLPEELRLPLLLFPERFDEKDPKMQRMVTAWLKKTKPDAIFHDFPPFPHLLGKAAYRVPEDIGMASTTIFESDKPVIDAGLDQNSEEIGRVAVLVLLSQINDNARGIPPISRQILVQGRWVDGASLPRRA